MNFSILFFSVLYIQYFQKQYMYIHLLYKQFSCDCARCLCFSYSKEAGTKMVEPPLLFIKKCVCVCVCVCV